MADSDAAASDAHAPAAVFNDNNLKIYESIYIPNCLFADLPQLMLSFLSLIGDTLETSQNPLINIADNQRCPSLAFLTKTNKETNRFGSILSDWDPK